MDWNEYAERRLQRTVLKKGTEYGVYVRRVAESLCEILGFPVVTYIVALEADRIVEELKGN